MFKVFISKLGEEERALFLQEFKNVHYFLTLLKGMLGSVNGRLGNLDPSDLGMPMQYACLRVERDLLLEIIQVVEE